VFIHLLWSLCDMGVEHNVRWTSSVSEEYIRPYLPPWSHSIMICNASSKGPKGGEEFKQVKLRWCLDFNHHHCIVRENQAKVAVYKNQIGVRSKSRYRLSSILTHCQFHKIIPKRVLCQVPAASRIILQIWKEFPSIRCVVRLTSCPSALPTQLRFNLSKSCVHYF